MEIHMEYGMPREIRSTHRHTIYRHFRVKLSKSHETRHWYPCEMYEMDTLRHLDVCICIRSPFPNSKISSYDYVVGANQGINHHYNEQMKNQISIQNFRINQIYMFNPQLITQFETPLRYPIN